MTEEPDVLDLAMLDVFAGNQEIMARVRSGEPLDDYDQLFVSGVDRMIDKSPLTEDVRVYRGATSEWLPKNLAPGTKITDRAFLHTTSDVAIAQEFASSAKKKEGVLFVLDVQKGTKALHADSYNDHMTGNQLVLARESTLVVASDEVEDVGGKQVRVIRAVVLGGNPKTPPAVDWKAVQVSEEVVEEELNAYPDPDGGQPAEVELADFFVGFDDEQELVNFLAKLYTYMKENGLQVPLKGVQSQVKLSAAIERLLVLT